MHQWAVGDNWNPATIPLCVWVCEQCGLASLFPVPEGEQIPDAGDWWSARRARPRRRRWLKRRLEQIRAKIFGTPADRLLRATRHAVASGRLLDIGCGDGRLLREAGKYYDCLGVEPSPKAAQAARAKGFEIVEDTFENAVFPPESFDVVLMDSIIEHVADPVGVMEKVNSVLRLGGIAVLRTPKFGGPSYRIHGPAWNGFRHGYHRFLFSGDTLAACLHKAGFEVLTSPRRNRPLDDILILWGQKSRRIVKKSHCSDSTANRDRLVCAGISVLSD